MTASRVRTDRIEFRTSPETRRLIDRAVEATGGSLTEFAESNLVDAARRVLADRVTFELPPEALAAWDALNERPAQELAGLRALLDRKSPFAD